jgi:hypothetical protein
VLAVRTPALFCTVPAIVVADHSCPTVAGVWLMTLTDLLLTFDRGAKGMGASDADTSRLWASMAGRQITVTKARNRHPAGDGVRIKDDSAKAVALMETGASRRRPEDRRWRPT